jgi:hypothetical protein
MMNNTDIEMNINEKAEKQPKRFLGLPIFSWVFFGMAALGLIVMLCYMLSEGFANFYNRYPAAFFRGVLASVSGILPCSLAEAFIIMSPLLAVSVIIYANKRFTSSWREVGRFLLIVLSVASLFFSTFALNFGAGYHTSSVDKLLELDREDVSAEQLRETAEYLVGEINKYTDRLAVNAEGSTVMPYGYEKLSEKLVEAYDKVCDEYEFVSRFPSRVKPVMLSEPWTYTHISGVYTYFSGEANINVNFPDYTLPYTAAHEMAHQRGVAREDEANFVAFLVCMESSDPYIRYSGALNLYEYVSGALAVADQEKYIVAHTELCREARGEIIAYGEFYEKYRESVASEITGTVNDTFLKLQGTEGTASYGLVVDLAVAYFKAN